MFKKRYLKSQYLQGDDNCYYEKIGKNEPVKLDDLPFDIPDNWTWIRFPNLVNFILGKTPERHTPKYWNKGKYPWFSIADMKDKSIVYESKEKISEDSLKENFNYSLSPIGTLLMSFKLTVGRVSILGVDAVHNEAIISIFPYLKDNNDIRDWLFYTLGILVNFVNQTDAIKGSTLNKGKISSMLIPLPPLPEQRKIISKINSFEPLLQEYEGYEKKLTELESTFADKLKKSILQYAIEGKLVKQDPNDEPASVLLERIKAEKEKLIKEGKIKRDKNESFIYQGDDRNYYEKINKTVILLDIPFNSIALWTKLKNIAFITKLAGFEYSEYVSPNLSQSGIPLFKGKNVQNSQVIYEFEGYIPLEISNKLWRSQVTKKCILTPYVGTIGNVGIHDKPGIYHLGSNVGKIEIYNNYSNNVLEEYVFYYLKSYTGYEELTKFKKATAQESISIDAIRETMIPIYSLKVQKLIVNKLNTINQLID